MKKKNNTLILMIIAIILFIMIVCLLIIKRYSLANNINYNSSIYKIENNFIENISPETTPELYKKYFDRDNCIIKVVDENNQEITANYVYTGSITNVYDTTNNKIATYTNIITGDITKDGQVNTDDLNKLANYLVTSTSLKPYEAKAIDLNNDNQIKINDLTILEELLQSPYKNITLNKNNLTLRTGDTERLIATITPNKILNQNAIWTSSDESVATVDESGVVTPHNDGETIITATTIDKTISATTKIIVDNTPSLSSTSGIAYVGGKDLTIPISATNYQDLSCKVENELLASCNLNNNILTISPIRQGTTTVKIVSAKYWEATYDLTIILTNLSIYPKTYCFKPNASYAGGAVSPMNAGTIELLSISDKEIVSNAYIINKNLGVTTGAKTGDAEIVFKENNGNKTATITAYVYKLSLEKTSGIIQVNDSPVTIKITNENAGSLTCSSNAQEIATCTIEDNNLIITPVSPGETKIKVSGSKCGNGKDAITYTVTVEEEVTE